VHPMTSSLDTTQWKNSNSIFSTEKKYLWSDSSKKSKLIASLVASGHICAFTKYAFKLNSLLLKRQKKNSLRNNTSAKHSFKQQTFTSSYLLICHCKKKRNSMTYLTNIDSFSKAPLDSYPPNLSMLNSNPTASLSMDAITRILPFWISLLIASLAGDWWNAGKVQKLVESLASTQRSCGKVWKDQISSNIWMYNYIYLKFFYKQGWAKKLQGTEKSEKNSLKNFKVYFKVSFKVPLKFLQSFF
jgi:hypothetical protein